MIRIRPLIHRIADEPLAWSLEIDLSEWRERGDLEAMRRFAGKVALSSPEYGWYAVETVKGMGELC